MKKKSLNPRGRPSKSEILQRNEYIISLYKTGISIHDISKKLKSNYKTIKKAVTEYETKQAEQSLVEISINKHEGFIKQKLEDTIEEVIHKDKYIQGIYEKLEQVLGQGINELLSRIQNGSINDQSLVATIMNILKLMDDRK